MMPLAVDSCPRIYSDEGPEQYINTMTRIDEKTYQVNFRAFQFETASTSLLGVDCDILLCITNNAENCYKPCWGGQVPTTAVAPTAPTEPTGTTPTGPTRTYPPTSYQPTTGPTTQWVTTRPPITTEEYTTTEQPPTTTQEYTTEPPTSTQEYTTEALTTEYPTTETPTEEPSTPSEAPTSPTEAPTTAETLQPRRKRDVQSESEKGKVSDTGTKDKPSSTTIKDKAVFVVHATVSDPIHTGDLVCADKTLLNALYGIVGGLAALVAILVFTLLYLMHIGRRRKIQSSNVHANAPVYAAGQV